MRPTLMAGYRIQMFWWEYDFLILTDGMWDSFRIGGGIIGHIQYINILTWFRGFQVKIANFSSFFCLSIPKGHLDTKKTTPNIEV